MTKLVIIMFLNGLQATTMELPMPSLESCQKAQASAEKSHRKAVSAPFVGIPKYRAECIK